MMADEYEGGPLMRSRSHGLLSRGILREHWNLARSFEENGDTEQAAAHYEQILSIQPDYAPAHHRLGILSTMWGRFGDADEHFRQARMPAMPETATEESYTQENLNSERAAEARIHREIAAERGDTRQAAVAKPTRRRFQIGARLADAYYAQQEKASPASVVPERKLPHQWIAGQEGSIETISSAAASKSAQQQVSGPAVSTKLYEKGIRAQPRQAVAEYDAESDDQAEEAQETENRSTSQSTRTSTAPQATIRPTASSVRPSTSQAPLSRSAQLRENTLRPKQEVQPSGLRPSSPVAEESTAWRSSEQLAESRSVESLSSGTSGIRRISNQEPETFAAEEREYAETIERLSHVRQREKAARAELLEAEVEARVAQELEISLAERRLRLARAQLRLAQQQLDSAIEAGGGEPVSHEQVEPAAAIESLDEAEPRRSSDSRLLLPAPRRLKVQQTSAVEPEGNDFLSGISAEPPAISIQPESEEIELEEAGLAVQAEARSNPLSTTEAVEAEPAGANLPAEAAAMQANRVSTSEVEDEAEPAILLVGHAEEVEPAALVDSAESELLKEAPLEAEENQAVRQRHHLQRLRHLPNAPAHRQELPIRSLDEQTLRRREVTPQTTFAKKAPALPPTMLYR